MKAGCLVRSRFSRHPYLVVRVEVAQDHTKIWARSLRWETEGWAYPHELELIGNNYKAK